MKLIQRLIKLISSLIVLSSNHQNLLEDLDTVLIGFPCGYSPYVASVQSQTKGNMVMTLQSTPLMSTLSRRIMQEGLEKIHSKDI
jgi:hypothetical protein